MQIEVTAEQFAWNIRYPGPDGQFGTPDDVVTLNQLHFPVGQKVVVSLHSKDVIHSFFLPEFRVKQDAVPGMTTKVWFDASHVGQWEIACAELCGLGHYRMKGFLTADSPEDFQKWLAEQAASNAPPPAPDHRFRRRLRRPRPASPRPHRRPLLRRQSQLMSTAPVAVAHELPHGVHPEPTSFWRKYIFSDRPQGHRQAIPLLLPVHADRSAGSWPGSCAGSWHGRASRSPSWAS